MASSAEPWFWQSWARQAAVALVQEEEVVAAAAVAAASARVVVAASAAAAADSAATALAATALTAPGWVSSQRARGAAARADARRRALCFVLGGKEARRREDE